MRRSPWDDVDDEGAELASELAVLAGAHTSTPELIWYAIWEGYATSSSRVRWNRCRALHVPGDPGTRLVVAAGSELVRGQ